MANGKRPLGIDVLTAARQRIARVFDDFPRIYISFSGGKDSGVMMHLVMEEAMRRNRKVGVLFVDLEGQYRLTIDYVQEMYDLYAPWIEPYWVALPIHLRNAVSQFEPQWVCWERGREKDWIRKPPATAITDEKHFPFFRRAMEFEEFVPEFGYHYAQNQLTCCFVGIRTQESLNRWRTLCATDKEMFEGLPWTTWCYQTLYNAYPIYDWETEDVWTYYGKERKTYNRLYDRMHKAGLTIHQARICQPYGDDQRKGLWLFHVIEPETWTRVVARVNGANQGALYAQERGNMLGLNKVTKPDHLSWEQFATLLVSSMPPHIGEHYQTKINVFLRWWQENRGLLLIPDEVDAKIESERKLPSWRRICKTLLRNDYWAKSLSFSVNKSGAYERYKANQKLKRKVWDPTRQVCH